MFKVYIYMLYNLNIFFISSKIFFVYRILFSLNYILYRKWAAGKLFIYMWLFQLFKQTHSSH